jgi:class 3 adenylate cyclase/response regulator of citrate/malate metabolism
MHDPTNPPRADDDDAPAWTDESPRERDPGPAASGCRWKVVVVDDEPAVHSVSRLALQRLTVDGVPLDLYSAHSAREGRAVLAEHPDAALLLLDVVMESDDAGLRLVEWLRRDRANTMTRIVLRTGQPGLAPEMEVMANYDINDYLAKMEVTTQRLITSVIAGVRAYRDLRTITIQRSGLHKVIDATATLFDANSVEQLLSGILEQVSGLLLPRESSVFFVARRPLFEPTETTPTVIAASGRFSGALGRPVHEVLDAAILRDVERSLAGLGSVERGHYSVYSFDLGGDARPVLYLDGGGALESWEHQVISLFCANAGMALRNHRLYAEREQWLRAFERFVPKPFVHLVQQQDLRRVRVGDHLAREMSILFLDIVGFTARCETMAPPAVFELLNRLYAVIGPCLEQYGGIIDKYLGDGVMVLFPSGPQEAVEAALAAVEAIARFNRDTPLPDGPLVMGLGLHHGPVIVGMVGHPRRMAPTVIADTVNTAARIQEHNRVLGTTLLMSYAVAERIAPDRRPPARSLGSVILRGRARPVELLEVFAADPAPAQARKAATSRPFAAAVAALERREFAAAADLFAEVVAADPDDPVARHFHARCAAPTANHHTDESSEA